MSYVARLMKFTTCDIADGLLNLYKIENGGYFPNLQCWVNPKGVIAGRAHTVLFEPSGKVREEVNYIDNVPANSILILGFPLSLQLPWAPYVTISQAMYGGLMATRAKVLGSNGSIVLGRIRDIDEHKALGQPLYSYGLGACAAKMAVKPSLIGASIPVLAADGSHHFIVAGDYIIADSNGVVRIPAQQVDMEKLLHYIEKSREVDELVAEDIRNGAPAKKAQKDRRAVLTQFM